MRNRLLLRRRLRRHLPMVRPQTSPRRFAFLLDGPPRVCARSRPSAGNRPVGRGAQPSRHSAKISARSKAECLRTRLFRAKSPPCCNVGAKATTPRSPALRPPPTTTSAPSPANHILLKTLEAGKSSQSKTGTVPNCRISRRVSCLGRSRCGPPWLL